MTSNSTYSLLRAQPRVSLRDTVPLRAPFALYVEPTNICNFKCVYCPESFSDFEKGLATARLISRVRAHFRSGSGIGGVKTLTCT